MNSDRGLLTKNDYDILLSVVVITYGQEAYIRQALDSILMQEVNFKYEIIVGEDSSPDNTREILKEYEVKYCDYFVMIYRDKNIGASRNLYDVELKCRGKYIATLEGDDYWTDRNKLQRQVDFLEANGQYIAVSHQVKVIDENNQPKDASFPFCKENVYTLEHYKKGQLPGQLATIVKRNYFKEYPYDFSIFILPDMSPSDRIQTLILALLGNVYCIKEVMSAYRFVTSGGTSFSANYKPRTHKQTLTYYNNLWKFNNAQTKNKNLTIFLEKKQLLAAVHLYGIKSIKEWKYYLFAAKYKGSLLLGLLILSISWSIKRIYQLFGS